MESTSKSDSMSTVSSTANSITKCGEDALSAEEQSLLQTLLRGISETTEEHVVYNKEILTLLSTLNLEPKDLAEDIQEGLQKVSSILRSNGLSDLDETKMSIVNERMKIEDKRRQREKRKLALIYDDIFRKYAAFSKKLNHLQEAVNCLKCTINNAQKFQEEDVYCNQILLSQKLEEYQDLARKLEGDLVDMDIEKLYPEKILNKYKEYLEMSGELAELNQFLGQYGDLPPNLLQAKALLETKKREYEILEKEFLQKTNYS